MTSASQASPDSSLSLQFALCKAAAVAPTRTTLAMTDVMRSTLSVAACARRAAQRRRGGAAVVCCEADAAWRRGRGRRRCFLDGGHFLDVVHGVNCGCWKENYTDDGEGCSPKKRKPTLQLFFSPESSKPVICKDRQLLVRSLLHVRQLPQLQKLCGFSHKRVRAAFAGAAQRLFASQVAHSSLTHHGGRPARRPRRGACSRGA